MAQQEARMIPGPDHASFYTKDDLKDILREFNEETGLFGVTLEEREYIRMKIRAERKRAERLHRFQLSIIGTVTTLTVGGIVSALIWVGSHVLKGLGKHP